MYKIKGDISRIRHTYNGISSWREEGTNCLTLQETFLEAIAIRVQRTFSCLHGTMKALFHNPPSQKFLYADDASTDTPKLRTSFPEFWNLLSSFNFLKKSDPTLLLEIFAEYSSHRVENPLNVSRVGVKYFYISTLKLLNYCISLEMFENLRSYFILLRENKSTLFRKVFSELTLKSPV